jgi:Ca2+-dependent lipid-binding protein
VHGVHLSFDMHEGNLNVNSFCSLLAVGELKKAGKLRPGEPMPNQLQVRIVRARNLKAMDYNLFSSERTSDPYVRVKVRNEEYVTRTQYKTLNPMYDQTFELFCDDPSAVLHVSLFDEDVGSQDFLGQWYCTVKYLKDCPMERQVLHGPRQTWTLITCLV